MASKKSSSSSGVNLRSGETGSSLLFRILSETTERFGTALSAAQLPRDSKTFKKTFGDATVRFEAARIASPQRVDIARHLQKLTLEAVQFTNEKGARPLSEALQEQAQAPQTETRKLSGTAGLVPEVPLDGKIYRGPEVHGLIDKLHHAHHLSDSAATALRWMMDHVASSGGKLDLTGHTFALLGAAAELSPVQQLLKAGATIRWVDVKPAAQALGTADGLAGEVISSTKGDDLLDNPQAVAASIRQLAAKGPVHLGLFAYAPGASRELRLAASMNSLVTSLGADVVRSVSMFISPTSPGELQPEDLRVATSRKTSPKRWQKGFELTKLLFGPGHYGSGGHEVARGAISIQGAAYQAAQYLTKIISAEVLAVDGLGGKPVTVSANVAGITETRSLKHPVFQIAFQGAPSFGVRIFEPPTTRALSSLLMLHDLLNPKAPGNAARTFENENAKARAIRSEQIHGGVYDLPWQFESAVRTAAVIGFKKRPGLLFGR